ncbi:acetate kinase [Thermoleptolyngbya oregonensis NK1-22]|uniref:Acetate kinase n=1 Tax=Thermoleptolyngbya oregonensis NK1-22 TaxID=2547457 RepID=A0AA96Y370_9CYAN|nr:acetate kinase [Thermoleptolyngbya oregonensis]WOB43847.1 acetate kinase [Thermoleptolyngbya oregonensis NK1-22]
MKILVMNAGSSSQKSCLYELPEAALPEHPPEPLWEAQIDLTHAEGVAEIKVKTAAGVKKTESYPTSSRVEATHHLLETLWTGDTKVIDRPGEIDMVGHRVVHGGEDYRASVFVTAEVKAAIARLAKFAPVHNPVNLEGIETLEQILGSSVPQVAVFDTAFHGTLPPAAYVYPGPYAWLEQGIRRYGFHGTSHSYCAQRAAQLLGRPLADLRLMICHLGNGASLSAVRGGQCVDTTMGFTPLEGLMMGSRSGSVDPGILLYLIRDLGYTPDQVDTMLNRESGLEGVSGVSNDMRLVLEAIAQGNERAKLAIDVYIHRLRSLMGSMLASLGGLEAIVFTAGVGENAPNIWQAACEPFQFLGLRLDPAKLSRNPDDQDIAAADSTVRVLIIHTQEDWAIAQDCWHLSKTLVGVEN